MRKYAFATAALFPFVIACGGSEPKSVTPSASSAAPAGVDAGPTTTTTMTLGDAGDLQGTKLTSSSQTTIDNNKSDAGSSGSGHVSEPGRGRDDIMVIIQTRRDQARACYDAALKTHPGIEGKLDIQWKIDPAGNVVDTSVDDSKSDIHEPSVAQCIFTIIRGIKFAESKKGFETRMHYPYDFHPRGNRP